VVVAESLRGMVQCGTCHNYAPADSAACPSCKALLPKGLAEQRARARNLPTERAQQQAAYDRFKQEATYVPRWMRKVVLAFNYAYEDSGVHRLVQWGSGALGFFLAFGVSAPLIAMIPLPGSLRWTPHKLLPAQMAVGLLAFAVTSRFIFAIYHTIVETMVQVFGDEQDARILQGSTRDKYRQNFKDR
jgi:hypothetical protein